MRTLLPWCSRGKHEVQSSQLRAPAFPVNVGVGFGNWIWADENSDGLKRQGDAEKTV